MIFIAKKNLHYMMVEAGSSIEVFVKFWKISVFFVGEFY